MGKSREEEHRAFLDWLIETIDEHKVDALIVAGDIFDTGTPPNYALELYYTFLKRLCTTTCRTTIITAGNHDSIATLNAPKEILGLLDVHVVSSGEEDNSERIIKLYDNLGALAGVVCAVPFLRDGVVRKGVSGESHQEKEAALIEGMEDYYNEIADAAQEIIGKEPHIPVIATGHFTTVGGQTSDSEREIYIGSTMNIPSNFLAERFDYVALGHLHRSQKVGSGCDHVRYSGSPIPLSFSEAGNRKKVTIVGFDGAIPLVEEVEIPTFRNLYRIKGSKEEILDALKEIEDEEGWTEVEIIDDNTYAALQEIQEYADAHNLTLLAKKVTRSAASVGITELEIVDLDEITPLEMFMKRLELDDMEDEVLREKLITEFKTIENEVATA
ncbi:nuclease SbcCD subunit D (plasmid) [Hydrogenimonas cancrithermarum]|uniref:Nuclease SbcCD subunit D n=2 Tax=Hydrogenimonas cancrithermarum TaxID=2993563 RepID=A0ABM8FNS3_9BACT|nr:nuclease SbcCD subunit D [Hydrogenimonas cancrithermarum]